VNGGQFRWIHQRGSGQRPQSATDANIGSSRMMSLRFAKATTHPIGMPARSDATVVTT
jgi:hypothetical protein